MTATPYAELHCLTNFSFLRAASHPDELVSRAAELGYRALAITDRNSLAGVVRGHGAAKELGLKLLIGAEIHPTDGPPLVLLATDRASYGQLARLLTVGKRRAPKGECELSSADIAEYAAGLIACISGPSRLDRSAPSLPRYRETFGDRCYLLAELYRGPDDQRRLEQLITLSRHWNLPLVAAGDIYYHVPARRPLQDVLTATRLGCTVAQAGRQLFANAERHLKTLDEIAAKFAGTPEIVARTCEVAERCTFSLDELRYEYPEELCPADMTASEHLARLTWQGAADRYPQGLPDKVRNLLDHELRLIEELHYEAYFLTVWDLVKFARRRGILCQGRGSAANSAVCYCLGVTAVDPERVDVLFERFISRERNEAPDIDLDFEHERREEVIQYLYNKYGRERAGLTAEVICYRSRSAVRDVGKSLGIAPEQVDALAQTLQDHHRRVETKWDECCRDGGLDPQSRLGQQFMALVAELVGFPRHLSQHVGGMVITQGPLCELTPIENAAMADRTVIEWNKDDLDTLGILKVDCLALGMLTAIRKCFDLVERHYGRLLTLATIPPEDPAVYEMISQADTMGVFQIESRAQMSMLPRLRPRSFYDLVIEVAIVRPGPIQGNMVHPYLRRRGGEEPIDFPNDAVRQVLEKTLGVPIFQEQAMRLAVVAAGFTPGEADQLRRAMGAWRRPGIIDHFQQRLIDGMQANGLSAEFAQRVYQQICGFGEYGFPESHAASFALLVYVSAWLKHHYPAAFCAALINSQPMGFYAPAQLIRDARQHGVEVLPADVNLSEWDVTLEEELRIADCGLRIGANASLALQSEIRNPKSAITSSPSVIRLGLRQLSGLPQAAVKQLIEARKEGPFRSLDDFAQRTRLRRPVLIKLARAQAFGSLHLDRRGALWHALAQEREENRPLFAHLERATDETMVRPTALPELTPAEDVLADYRTIGLSLRAHPLEFYRAALEAQNVVPAGELLWLDSGVPVRVAGLVIMRQRPGTAKGITFVTLEDETGVANVIVRPAIWQQFRDVARGATAWIADGRLERQGQVIHIVASHLLDLRELSQSIDSQSRDFR